MRECAGDKQMISNYSVGLKCDAFEKTLSLKPDGIGGRCSRYTVSVSLQLLAACAF